jgi:DNA-binding IclR family transcriptional regulator
MDDEKLRRGKNMADTQKEWLTLQEIAEEFNVPLYKVRNTIATLKAINTIATRDRPTDRRILEVHKDSLATIKQALLGD